MKIEEREKKSLFTTEENKRTVIKETEDGD